MRYIQPTILRTDNAISAIQSTQSSNPLKPADIFVDAVLHQPATQGAYEADE